MVPAGYPVQDFYLLVLRVVPPLYLLQDDVLVHVLVLVHSRECVGSVDHDPAEPFVGLFALPRLSDGGPDPRSDTLLVLNYVLLF